MAGKIHNGNQLPACYRGGYNRKGNYTESESGNSYSSSMLSRLSRA